MLYLLPRCRFRQEEQRTFSDCTEEEKGRKGCKRRRSLSFSSVLSPPILPFLSQLCRTSLAPSLSSFLPSHTARHTHTLQELYPAMVSSVMSCNSRPSKDPKEKASKALYSTPPMSKKQDGVMPASSDGARKSPPVKRKRENLRVATGPSNSSGESSSVLPPSPVPPSFLTNDGFSVPANPQKSKLHFCPFS
jgi:hypothetical protein